MILLLNMRISLIHLFILPLLFLLHIISQIHYLLIHSKILMQRHMLRRRSLQRMHLIRRIRQQNLRVDPHPRHPRIHKADPDRLIVDLKRQRLPVHDHRHDISVLDLDIRVRQPFIIVRLKFLAV